MLGRRRSRIASARLQLANRDARRRARHLVQEVVREERDAEPASCELALERDREQPGARHPRAPDDLVHVAARMEELRGAGVCGERRAWSSRRRTAIRRCRRCRRLRIPSEPNLRSPPRLRARALGTRAACARGRAPLRRGRRADGRTPVGTTPTPSWSCERRPMRAAPGKASARCRCRARGTGARSPRRTRDGTRPLGSARSRSRCSARGR